MSSKSLMQMRLNDKDMLVSIITPCYNAEKYIMQTIESVLLQTYPYWELIIVDDCSTDNSVKIIEKFAQKDGRIKLFKLENNSGPAVAKNCGIKFARGRYIAFLDADDLWLPEKLEKQIDFMNKEKLAMTYSSYFIIDRNNNVIGIRKSPNVLTYKKNLKSNFVGNLTGIYDTLLVGKIYAENVKHEDYTLWMKILKKIEYAKGIQEPLAKYRTSVGISKNKLKAALWQWNILRKIENLNIIKSLYYFSWYIFYGIKRRIYL